MKLRPIVFTLQSIKSRIETVTCNDRRADVGEFLLYSPLNQGLKQRLFIAKARDITRFLLYSPLNQGLKHNRQTNQRPIPWVFTLQSIKSRIETIFLPEQLKELFVFLLYSPLNQGLKHGGNQTRSKRQNGFLLYSPLNQGLKLIFSARCLRSRIGFYSTVH